MDNKTEFNKVLNAGDVLVTAFGAMIGWGWVVSSGDWIKKAGALGTVIGFLIGGAMIYLVGMVYSELTTAIPENGGPSAFTKRAYGPVMSFICTWAIILSYIGVVCFEACSFPTIIQYIFPGFLKVYLYTVAGFDIYATWLLLATVAAVLIIVVNIRGIKAAVILQKVLTIAIALVGIILIIASAINGSPSNLDGQLLSGSDGNQIQNILSIAVVAPFFLFGFDVIPQAAEEINVPLKKLGKLLLLSIILAVAFYGFVVMAVGYGMNSSEIETSLNTSGLVTADAMAKLFNSSVMAKILILGGLCGIVTSWNSFLIGGSRALCSMSEAGMLPRSFGKLHPKYKTPTFALIFIGALSIASLFCGRSMLVWISNSASFACCFAYCLVSVAYIRLRKTEPDLNRPYKVKNYKLVGGLAILLSGALCLLYLIPGTASTFAPQEFFITGGWTLLGLLLGIVYLRKSNQHLK